MKTLGVLALGIFVGAVIAEVIRREKPDLFSCDSLKKAKDTVVAKTRTVTGAFREGYQKASADHLATAT